MRLFRKGPASDLTAEDMQFESAIRTANPKNRTQTILWIPISKSARTADGGSVSVATEAIYRVAFSPNGKRIASASHGGSAATIWNASSGRRARRLTGPEVRSGGTVWGNCLRIRSLAFSPDGKRLATASDDKTVKIWSVGRGKQLLALEGHTDIVRSVVFSPDGTRLASAGDDKMVKIWDAASGQELLTLKGHTDIIRCVAFSPNGTRLASASNDLTVKVWDARPWTPHLKEQLESRALLGFLVNTVESREELTGRIRSDDTISEAVKRQALQWADLFWHQQARGAETK